ncbi:hypothetical protein CLV30_12541 [Haloactinopolyspora alba]|uniref:Uncharacterized protein n=1 Tax=Haloactinopolyspora alba TaxID=648780 RepID=A0A2P8DHG2_9ACTN|nr:hypothetical protein [Haloactinopolyspora alba]PSK96660.1 hypothetical protein CLV30_12541 [Haloactinopolyspora alba]
MAITSDRLQNAVDTLWVLLAVLIWAVIVTYGYGLLALAASEYGDACAPGLAGDSPRIADVHWTVVPPQKTCVLEDGTTRDVAPALSNRIFVGALASSVVCAAVAVRIRNVLRSRDAAEEQHDTDEP